MNPYREKVDRAVNEHFKALGGSVLFSTSNPLVCLPLHNVPKRWRWVLSGISRVGIRGSIVTHGNYRTFHTALMSFKPDASARMFESGSSAYGTNSTALLANIAEIVGCGFDTVDIDKGTSERASSMLKQSNHCAHCLDSVEFLERSNQMYCFAYLDSYDLDAVQLNEAADHGLGNFWRLRTN